MTDEDSSEHHWDQRAHLQKSGPNYPKLIAKETKKKALADKKKEKKQRRRRKRRSLNPRWTKRMMEVSLMIVPEPKHKDADVVVGVKDVKDAKIEKEKVMLPSECTSVDFDMYDIVDDELPRGKRFVDCRKRHADASPCSDASIDVPDDVEYLTEWDEWSEIENGRGPKASWGGEYWDTMSGMISKLSSAPPGMRTIIKNGKRVKVDHRKDPKLEEEDNWISFPTMPCTVTDEHDKLIAQRSLMKAWGARSSMLWSLDQLEELRLGPIPKPKNPC
eukprot:s1948_g5.t1